MTFSHQTGDDFSSGTFLKEPGWYHLCVTEMDETPINRQGQLIDNAAFRVHFEALAGTVGGQEGKAGELTFFHPRPTSKDGGKFARKKIDRFLLAVGLIDENVKGKAVDIDVQQAVGRHFVAKLEANEHGYLELAFTEVYHPDDPAVAHQPKDAAAMAIPGTWRKIGAKPAGHANGNGNGAAYGNAPAASAAAPWESSL